MRSSLHRSTPLNPVINRSEQDTRFAPKLLDATVWLTGTASQSGVTYAVGVVVSDGGRRWLDTAGGSSTTSPTLDQTGRWVPLDVPPGDAAPTRSLMPPSPNRGLIQDFGSHAWSASGSGGTTNLTSTTNPDTGATQNVRVTTLGTGGTRNLFKTGISPAVSMTGRQFSLRIYVTNTAHLKQLSISHGDTAFTNFWLTYEQSTVPSSNGSYIPEATWVWVDIPWHLDGTTGAPTRSAETAIQITVGDDNTGNVVTVDVQKIGWVPVPTATSSLPNGCVLLDLDDGSVNQYTFALPLLAANGFAPNMFPIIEDVTLGNGSGFMSLTQLQAAQNVYGAMVGGHASTVARHTSGLAGLTAAQQDVELRTIRAWLYANGLTSGIDHYAYPQGNYVASALPVVSRYFNTARTTAGPRETIPSSDPMRVRCLVYQAGVSTATVTAAIDDAYANGYALRILNHDLVTSGASGFAVLQSDYTTIVNYLVTKGIPVLTIPQLLGKR